MAANSNTGDNDTIIPDSVPSHRHRHMHTLRLRTQSCEAGEAQVTK